MLLAGLTRVLSWLPLAAARRTGDALGTLVWLAHGNAARVTRINLALCFPELGERERRRLARRSLRQTSRLLGESGVTFRWPAARWRALVQDVQGERLVADALAGGRGVLVLVPHLGNWEFLSLYLGRYRMLALYDPPRLRGLEAPIRAARERGGAQLLAIDRGGMRALFEALRARRLVALLPDQVPRRQAGVYVPFFGVPALTMTFAHRLIQRTSPVVVLATALRVRGGFAIRFVAADPDVADADPVTAAAAMNRAIETLVRSAPDQYQWEYRRFRRPPPGRPSVYE